MHNANGRALLPLGLFFFLYILTFLLTGDLNRIPVSVAFAITSIAALLSAKGTIATRIRTYCNGASNPTIMQMILIFILAGAFAGSAKATGAADATVNAVLSLLPAGVIPAGMFIAACFISIAMGTSCGTIAALTPIALGLAPQTGVSLPEMLGIVIGGSMFGDNLSFISDTTIVATQTQNVRMTDKFLVNLHIIWPVALLLTLYYLYRGFGLHPSLDPPAAVAWPKILPYILTLVLALSRVNVMLVLLSGVLLSGAIGLFDADFTVWNWATAINNGIVHDMSELIIITLMAGGLFEVVRNNGGIDYLVLKITSRIRSKRKAEASIAALITCTDLCTANNTIALIVVGPIAKQIAHTFHIDPRRTASLLDTLSCAVQGLLPYGAQVLIASALTSNLARPVDIVSHLYYPLLIGLAALLAIVFQYPGKYTSRKL